MTTSRITKAKERLEAAIERVESAQARLVSEHAQSGKTDGKSGGSSGGGGARVMALVNSHEKLREEVADTLRELDAVIEEIGG